MKTRGNIVFLGEIYRFLKKNEIITDFRLSKTPFCSYGEVDYAKKTSPYQSAHKGILSYRMTVHHFPLATCTFSQSCDIWLDVDIFLFHLMSCKNYTENLISMNTAGYCTSKIVQEIDFQNKLIVREIDAVTPSFSKIKILLYFLNPIQAVRGWGTLCPPTGFFLLCQNSF